MKLNIITKQLFKELPANNKMKNFLSLSPQNFDECYSILKNKKIKNLNITDLTSTKLSNYNKIIKVKDHINKSGTNLIIGNQKNLKIDFIDLSKIYNYDSDSIITTCCGKNLNPQFDYPNHYLSNITILAHALKIPQIHAFLYNLP
tara:strand:+ start:348 stop:785 length:438 start_codon:yes stop_codon:yes gene_type:complete